MLTENGLGLKVDIEDWALGQQKINWVLRQHWGSSFRSTENELGLKVDIEDWGPPYNCTLLCRP